MSTAKILAIDTATEGCSAALLIEGQVQEQFEFTPRGHTHRILPVVEQLLREAGCTLSEMDAIAFNRGPGSFTGLRITAGVVQGLAYGVDRPVIPVSSLAALAAEQHRQCGDKQILSAIDARMGEVYWGAYQVDEQEGMRLLGEEAVLPPEAVEPRSGQWSAVGSGWAAYREALKSQFSGQLGLVDGEALPHAAAIARLAQRELELGHVISAAEAQPIYLRNSVVHQKK